MLSNEGLSAAELFDALQGVDVDDQAEYFICVPASPVDTGQAEGKGAVLVPPATAETSRLTDMLSALRRRGLRTEGEFGDPRPLRALACAVESFEPDRLVIAEPSSNGPCSDLVDQARSAYPIPVTCVVSPARE